MVDLMYGVYFFWVPYGGRGAVQRTSVWGRMDVHRYNNIYNDVQPIHPAAVCPGEQVNNNFESPDSLGAYVVPDLADSAGK